MGFMDWLDKSVQKDRENAWKDVDPATRKYYMNHPERMQGVHSGLGRSGPKQALIDLIGTDDLDALLHDCAPDLTEQANSSNVLNQETIARLKSLEEKLGDASKYEELKGRYEALREHYDELKAERNQLIEILSKKNEQAPTK